MRGPLPWLAVMGMLSNRSKEDKPKININRYILSFSQSTISNTPFPLKGVKGGEGVAAVVW